MKYGILHLSQTMEFLLDIAGIKYILFEKLQRYKAEHYVAGRRICLNKCYRMMNKKA